MQSSNQETIKQYLKLKQLLNACPIGPKQTAEQLSWEREYQSLISGPVPIGYDYVASYHERDGEVFLVEPGDEKTDYIGLKSKTTGEITYVFAEQFSFEAKQDKVIPFPKHQYVKKVTG